MRKLPDNTVLRVCHIWIFLAQKDGLKHVHSKIVQFTVPFMLYCTCIFDLLPVLLLSIRIQWIVLPRRCLLVWIGSIDTSTGSRFVGIIYLSRRLLHRFFCLPVGGLPCLPAWIWLRWSICTHPCLGHWPVGCLVTWACVLSLSANVWSVIIVCWSE